MNTAAANRGIRKGLRTIVQTLAGGGLTALVTVMADGLDPAVQGIVMGAFTALVALSQNWLETAGVIPTLLPSLGQVTESVHGGIAEGVGTVDAIMDTAGTITGDVLDTGGTVIGEVTGTKE